MFVGPQQSGLSGIPLPDTATAGDLTVAIETPDGQQHRPDYVDLRDSRISIRFTPLQVGVHWIDICYCGSRIKGSPFCCFVDSSGLRQHRGVEMGLATTTATRVQAEETSALAARSSGLAFSRQVTPVAQVGVCYQLKFRSTDGGELDKSMLVAFDGPEKVDVDLEERTRREYQLSYTFFAPGEYLMRVHIAGGGDVISPIPVRVVGDAVGIVGGSFFGVRRSGGSGEGGGGGGEEAWFSSSRQLALPVDEDAGLLDSGFSGGGAVGVYGEGVERGWTGRETSFEVQLGSDAGGPLTVTVDGPSKVDLVYTQVGRNLFRISYTPNAPGVYTLAVKLGTEMRHVLASPYSVTVL